MNALSERLTRMLVCGALAVGSIDSPKCVRNRQEYPPDMSRLDERTWCHSQPLPDLNKVGGLSVFPPRLRVEGPRVAFTKTFESCDLSSASTEGIRTLEVFRPRLQVVLDAVLSSVESLLGTMVRRHACPPGEPNLELKREE